MTRASCCRETATWVRTTPFANKFPPESGGQRSGWKTTERQGVGGGSGTPTFVLRPGTPTFVLQNVLGVGQHAGEGATEEQAQAGRPHEQEDDVVGENEKHEERRHHADLKQRRRRRSETGKSWPGGSGLGKLLSDPRPHPGRAALCDQGAALWTLWELHLPQPGLRQGSLSGDEPRSRVGRGRAMTHLRTAW